MKKKIAILTLTFITISCEKYPFLPDKYSEKFIGHWDWFWTSCPNSGYYLWADSTDYSMALILSPKGEFKEYKNDSLILSSDYYIEFDHSYQTSKYYNLITKKDDLKYLIVLYQDSILSISDYPIIDACEVLYRRK
jgi:hypothetical protein